MAILSEVPKSIREHLAEIGAKGGAATKGVTSKAKKTALRANGKLGGRPKIVDHDARKRVVAMYGSGRGMAAIAKGLKISRRTVAAHLKASGHNPR
jgi:DNA invertase Pin-like site-specific DNA recombinase